MLCFQLFGFYFFQIISEEHLRGQQCICETMPFADQTHITHPADGRPRDMSLQDRQTAQPFPLPALSRRSNAITQPAFPEQLRSPSPRRDAERGGRGAAAAAGAARSQRGGASHGRMPRMPERAAPTVWVTALKALKRGYL